MHFIESSEVLLKAEELFNKWSFVIENKIPNSNFEHIGSTAITGALTKGDIDFLLEVDSSAHSKTVSILSSLGLQVKPDTHRDTDLCMVENKEFSIQVITADSKYVFFKYFRDCLNNDHELVARYNEVKVSSAGLSEEEYRIKKSEFIIEVLSNL